jgi:hypothetical protein
MQKKIHAMIMKTGPGMSEVPQNTKQSRRSLTIRSIPNDQPTTLGCCVLGDFFQSVLLLGFLCFRHGEGLIGEVATGIFNDRRSANKLLRACTFLPAQWNGS